ncbi:MAG: DNA repair protein RecN [Chlamydiota bacterium]|nr:DNA repair protein RecN [Chlamydiota bacterium]
MLTRIYIKNIALIDELEIQLGAGFNVITGETGAGKSITVEALLLILGERASSSILRQSTQRAVVEASFLVAGLKHIKSYLDENAILLEDDTLIIKREIFSDGKSKAFVNGSQVTASFLKTLGEYLIDLHGQHEHQSLLKKPYQRDFLDTFLEIHDLRKNVSACYKSLHLAIKEKEQIESTIHTRQQQLDYLKFQEKEVLDLKLQPGEEESLINECKIASQAEHIRALLHTIIHLLNGQEPSLTDQWRTLTQTFQDLIQCDESLKDHLDAIQSTSCCLENLEMTAERRLQAIDIDPEHLRWMEERIFEIKRLKKKYGDDLTGFLESLQKDIRLLDNTQQNLELFSQKISQLQSEYDRVALSLRKHRLQGGKELSKTIEKELHDLGMKGASFFVQVSPTDDGATGKDEISFLISTNAGQPQKPIQDIISGGELSRVMLALKTLLRKRVSVPNLIFDEIDVNLGGETAKRVGKKLVEVARNHQIIVITHLAIIAAYAQHHFYIEKMTQNKSVSTRVRLLNYDDRKKEIARMLSGDNKHSVALTHAEELLNTVK